MGKSRILIVDDEPFNIDYIEQELEDAGYETFSASNGQEALETIQNQAPDLVLLDIMMPVMDGFEVLTHLKERPETREIPVIVISASNDLQSVVRGIKLGADDYLPKPFEPALLSARITSSLEKKHLRDLQKLYLKSLERELEIGHEIQMGFLPRDIPRFDGWEIAAFFKPAHEVAGDYYDVFTLPDGDLMCVVGDVCGKGVGAALYMSLFRSLIRATSRTEYLFNQNISQLFTNVDRLQFIVSYINKYMTETHGHTSMFTTVVVGIVDRKENKFSYINCGNEPAILLRNDGNSTLLWPTGPIIGVLPDAEFTPQEIVVEENELLLIYTDGVTDAMDMNEASFGRDRLMTFIQNEHEKNSCCKDLLLNLDGQIRQHIGQAEQFDDITILALLRG